MKKLFFVVLIATVAVGEAYTDTINLYPRHSSSPTYTCLDEEINSCATIWETYYESDGYTVIDFFSYYTLYYN